MNKQVSQPLQKFTLFESKRVMQFLASIMALPLIVLIHKKVGLRTLAATRIFAVAAVIWFFAGLADMNFLIFKPAGELFDMLPWVIIGAAWLQRCARWQEIYRGDLTHTFSPGLSYLEDLPLPAFLKAHRRLARFAEPAICFVGSMVFGMCVSVAVARIFALSSVALAIYQQALYENRLEADLNTLDSLLESEAQSETVKLLTESQANQEEQFFTNTVGTSTGIDIDLSRQIERLRAKRAATSSNLA